MCTIRILAVATTPLTDRFRWGLDESWTPTTPCTHGDRSKFLTSYKNNVKENVWNLHTSGTVQFPWVAVPLTFVAMQAREPEPGRMKPDWAHWWKLYTALLWEGLTTLVQASSAGWPQIPEPNRSLGYCLWLFHEVRWLKQANHELISYWSLRGHPDGWVDKWHWALQLFTTCAPSHNEQRQRSTLAVTIL